MKEYKIYQNIYNSIVSEHSDAFDDAVEIIEAEEIVENALVYFQSATFPLIYPAKSYGVAIVYATLIEELYGYPLRETLNDPELFCGQDPYFVPYAENPDTYEEILTRLKEIPNWLDSGWVPQTRHYFTLECTEEGINQITNSLTV